LRHEKRRLRKAKEAAALALTNIGKHEKAVRSLSKKTAGGRKHPPREEDEEELTLPAARSGSRTKRDRSGGEDRQLAKSRRKDGQSAERRRDERKK
jgi:hypothetical protein